MVKEKTARSLSLSLTHKKIKESRLNQLIFVMSYPKQACFNWKFSLIPKIALSLCLSQNKKNQRELEQSTYFCNEIPNAGLFQLEKWVGFILWELSLECSLRVDFLFFFCHNFVILWVWIAIDMVDIMPLCFISMFCFWLLYADVCLARVF